VITWTIAHPRALTGTTRSTSTASGLTARSTFFALTSPVASTSESSSYSSSTFSGLSSTTSGAGGATTFWTTSSSFSFSTSSSQLFGTSTSAGSFTTSSTSGSFSSSSGIATVNVATSTTIAQAQLYTATYSTEIESSAALTSLTLWTTSTEDDRVVFYTTAASLFATTLTELDTRTVTVDATTTLTQTTGQDVLSPAATVYQANTRDQNAEILYFVSNPDTTWNGYYPFTDEAQSGTRFTVVPSISTENAEVGAMRLNTSTSSTLPSQTFSVQWSASRTTTVESTAVTRNVLPNSTTATTGTAYTTTQSSLSGVILSSATYSWGATFSNASESATTSAVTLYRTRPTTVVQYFGNFEYETTVATTASFARTITTTALATGGTSGITLTSALTMQSASTVSASRNQTVSGPAQIVLFNSGSTGRTRFATTGAKIGTSAGGWFEFSDTELTDKIGFFSYTALDGFGRRGVTLFPTTNKVVTIDSQSITFRKSSGTSTTTQSGVVSLSGDVSTIVDSVSSGCPTHMGANAIGEGCTIIEKAAAGAYVDLINRQTTSFSGAATAMTEGETHSIRSWFPVPAIGPLENKMNRNALIFSISRNSTAPPPA